jgi:transcriptional regulator with XRE-family HTH domain
LEDTYLKEIGQRVAKARIAYGDSQEDLASRLGVSRYTVAKMENGHPGTKLGMLLKAANILGCLETFENCMKLPPDPFKAYDQQQEVKKKRRVGRKKVG